MNMPPSISKWAFLLILFLTFVIMLVKFYETWPGRTDLTHSLSVKEIYTQWTDDNFDKGTNTIYYQEIIPKLKAKLDILLLHGMRFTSTNWVELNTMDILASHGYHVIAVDLPGYGKSSYKLPSGDKKGVEFLRKFIEKTRLNSPVIVSPSASGAYSLPYLASSNSAKGFVAIAVTATDTISYTHYQHFPPTLIVQGSKDQKLGVTSTNLLKQYLPHNSVEVIQGAGHACYIEKPKQFHAILLKFLHTIVS